MKKLLGIALGILLALGAGSVAFAQLPAETASFTVEANVVGSCNFTAASGINFGDLDVPLALVGDPIDQTGTLTILCTVGPDYKIALDNGSNFDVSNGRQMQGQTVNTEFIAYELYQDSDHSTRWGTGAEIAHLVADGTRQVMTIYGRCPWNESLLPTASVQHYVDTVTASYDF
jgi:spore coat protein U-like protein